MPLPKVWVYAEGEDGKATSATLELLTKAREIGDTVEAVYSGADADTIAPQLGEYGATKVHSVDHGTSLSGVIGGALLAKLVADEQPDLILFAQSYDGRDAMGRLSVKLDRPVLTNGNAVEVDGDTVAVSTAVFGGNTIVTTAFAGEKPFLAGIRPKSFAPEPGGGGAAEVVNVDSVDAGRASEAQVLDHHVEEQEGPKLEDADVVVSGGRGLGSAEAYEPLVEELAKVLKGASGASRAIVDAGWVPYSKQVGQTGINKDPEAPIFSVSDLGVVGDASKVVPKLIEALKAKT
jgi:electron transfer flavoprotein alpha subunit